MAKKKPGQPAEGPADRPAETAAEAASTFEQSLAEVEQIVRDLEGGQLSLEDSLRAYELGVRRLRHCHQQLADVERRIEVLVGFDAEGRPISEPFDDPDDLSLEQKQAQRGRRRGIPRGECEEPADTPHVDDSPGLF